MNADDIDDAITQQSARDYRAMVECLAHDMEHGTRQCVEHVRGLLRRREAVRERCREVDA